MPSSLRLLLSCLEQSRLAKARNGNTASGLDGSSTTDVAATFSLWVAMGPKERFLWQRLIAGVVAFTLWIGPLQMVWQDAASSAAQLGVNKELRLAQMAAVDWTLFTIDLKAAAHTGEKDGNWSHVYTLLESRLPGVAAHLWASAGARLPTFQFGTPAAAAPISDPAAPIRFQPTITQSTGAGGGVPVVNITQPNAAGISLNQYSQFNVDVVGLILNNSLISGGSTLGGNVAANAGLNGHAATQIINQVNSSGSASAIAGTIEVFGTKADVIIVNPNGIGCNSCSFINTGRVVMSTGAPQFLTARGGAVTSFDSAAALAYDVQGGHIQIEGLTGASGTPGTGMEASNAIVDLIAATIGLNASVNAGAQLNVIAGQQLVSEAVVGQGKDSGDYNLTANGSTPPVATPSTYYAIDGTAFGAMNAGVIKVIGTAEGFGVRVLGNTVASSGPLTIDSNGDISGANVYSPDDLTLKAKGNIAASQVISYGAVTVVAAASSTPAAGNDVVIGQLTAATNAQVSGANLSLGQTVVGGDLTVTGTGSVFTGSSGAIAGDVNINAGALYVNNGNWTAGKNLTINAAAVQNSLSSQLLGLATTSITANDMANYGTLYGDNLRLRIANTLDNTFGSLLGKTLVDVQTGALISNYNGVLFAGDPNAAAGAAPSGDVSLTITGANGSFDNTAGTVAAGRNLTFSALNETFDTGATTSGAFNLNGVLTMNVGTFRNSVNWSLPGATAFISGVNGVSNSGVMQTLGDLNLASSAGIISNTGALVAGQDLNASGTINNAAGAVVHAERDVSINGVATNAGTVEAMRNINILGASYDNSNGVTQTNGSVIANLTGALTNVAGTIAAGRDVTLNAGSIINDRAAPVTVVSETTQVDDLNLVLSTYLGSPILKFHDDMAGDRYVATPISIAMLVPISSLSGNTLSGIIRPPCSNNPEECDPSEPYSAALPTVDAIHIVQTEGKGGQILAGNNAFITAVSLSNRGSTISAGNNLTAALSNLNNGASDAVIVNRFGETVNQASLDAFVDAMGSAMFPAMAASVGAAWTHGWPDHVASPSTVVQTIVSGKLGTLQAGHDATLNGTGNLVNAGNLIAGNNIAITLPGNFINQGTYSSQLTSTPGCGNGAYCSDPSSHVDTFAYSQTPNTVVAGGSLTVTAGTIANDYGTLSARGNVNLSANSVDNLAGTIQSTAGDVNIAAPIVTNRVVSPVMTQTSYGSINPDFAQGCNAGGRYKGSECTAEMANQASAAAVINGARDVNITGDSLVNYGSLITAGADANLNIGGSISNTDAALNTYWQGHWIEETCWTCSDVNHYTNGVIANGNQTATIQAGSALAMIAGDSVTNTGNLFGSDINLVGKNLLNGIMDASAPTAASTVAQQMIPVGPSGTASASGGAASTAAPLYAVSTPGSDALSSFGPDLLVANLPPALRPDTNLFYYDAASESSQIQQTALTQTGSGTFINGVSWDSTNGLSINDQQKAILYNNTIDYATANNIQLGQPLSAQQISSVDKPMLWYTEQSVPDPSCSFSATLCPNINALVPQVVLPQNYAGTTAGGVISGNNVSLTFADSITNTGIIQATTLAVTTNSLTNEQRSIDIGRQAYEVEGGWMEYTGTQLQPGGFMSAVNLNVQAQNITAVNDAFRVLNPDGTPDTAGTAALLATLKQTLGSNFTQSSVQDNIQNNFIQDTSGPGMLGQVIAIAIAIALSFVTAGAGLALVGTITGTTIAAGSMAAIVAAGLQAAIVGTLTSMSTQLITTGNLDFGQALMAGAVSGVIGGATAGVLGNAPGSPTPAGGVAASADSASTVVPATGGISQISQASWTDFLNNPMPYVTNTLIRSGISAGVNSLVYGDSFATALKNGIVADAAAAGANAIGDLNMPTDGESSNLAANIVEHALLGCVAGAASGSDCAGGAIGAAASAALAPDIIKAIDPTGTPLTNGQKALVAALAALSGGAAAGLAGSDATAGANSAANEAINNSENANHVAAEAKNGGIVSGFMSSYLYLVTALSNQLAGPTQSLADQLSGTTQSLVDLVKQSLVKSQNQQLPPEIQADNGQTPSAPAVITSGGMSVAALMGCLETVGAGCISALFPVMMPTSASNVMYSSGGSGENDNSNKSPAQAEAEAYAASRSAQLQSELPAGSQGRVTMGVGVLRDTDGNQITVVSTSEPNGYLRPGVTLNPGEIMVPGTGHAEADIVNYANQHGYTVQTIGAGRPICPTCAATIGGVNAVPATPLKVTK